MRLPIQSIKLSKKPDATMSDLKTKDCPECERRFAVIYAEKGQREHPYFCPHCGYEFWYIQVGGPVSTTNPKWVMPFVEGKLTTTGV